MLKPFWLKLCGRELQLFTDKMLEVTASLGLFVSLTVGIGIRWQRRRDAVQLAAETNLSAEAPHLPLRTLSSERAKRKEAEKSR